jgi:hypothetical protein
VVKGKIANGNNNVKPNIPKKTSWFDKLKKAFGWGKQLLEFALPLLLTNASDGSKGSLSVGGRNRSARQVNVGEIGIASEAFVPGSGHPTITTKKNRYVITHSGLLANVDIPANTERGDLLFRVSLDPRIEQWLQSMSNFEKYRFNHVWIQYVPTVSTTEAGSLAAFFEWDPDDPLQTGQGEDTLREVMAHESAQLSNVWRPMTLVFHGGDEPHELWYVDSNSREKRLCEQGVFNVVAGSDFTAALSAGQLVVVYEIEFEIPELRSVTHGTFCMYDNGASTDADTPFGDAIDAEQVVYADDLTQDEIVPQNAYVRYFKSSNLYSMNVPDGYWVVVFRSVGTGLGDATITMSGAYRFLEVDSANWYYKETSSAQTSAYAFCVFYSSGVAFGVPTGELPDSGLDFTLSAATTVSASQCLFVRLNGYPNKANTDMWAAIRRLTAMVKANAEEKSTVTSVEKVNRHSRNSLQRGEVTVTTISPPTQVDERRCTSPERAAMRPVRNVQQSTRVERAPGMKQGTRARANCQGYVQPPYMD